MMNESQEPDESPDESLADVPPTPIDEADLPVAGNAGMGAIALTVGGAAALALIASSMIPSVGATRSSKLEWERRQVQIEQAERDAQVDSQVDAQPDQPHDAQPHAGEND